MTDANELDPLFERLRRGDASARDELFPILYDELHRLAQHEMARQGGHHTLQATALVNEAYLKLCRGRPNWNDHAHFLRLSGKAMRQILVDHARRKTTRSRQDPGERVPLDDLLVEFERQSGGVLALDEALARLEQRDPELVRLVELRFFSGCTMDQVAQVLEISPRAAARRWEMIRLVLKNELTR